MNFHVTLEDKVPQIRSVNLEDGRTVMKLGAGSYVGNSHFITWNRDVYVQIGSYSVLSCGVTFVFDTDAELFHTTNYNFELEDGTRQIIIGSDVRVEANVTLLSGVHIGDGAVVRAGSVVVEDVPPYAVAAGNPAQITGYRFDAETIDALRQIAWWNWSEAKIRDYIPLLRGDVMAFLARASDEQAGALAPAEETHRKLHEFYSAIERNRTGIGQMLRDGSYEQAIQEMILLARALYDCNQTYTDDVLERYLDFLAKELPEISSSSVGDGRKRIVFYDGFGLDTRGLVLIFLRALRHMDAEIFYVAPESARDRIPTIAAVLEACGGTLYFFPDNEQTPKWIRCLTLCNVLEDIRPNIGFLYTTPWDIEGILAFMHSEGRMKRYQINLTDHAFWLGRNAFDYCLEFRDFGANLSRQYRHIPMQKLLKQPYYPLVDPTIPYGGLPFERADGDFVIFSGGTLYKTLDREKTYYRIVDCCLRNFPQVKFWYAGMGQEDHTADLRTLVQNHPGRVFVTGEREDLFQVLRHVDMYLNTCPHYGGLMTQYSIAAGRVPFTFLCLPKEESAASVLLSQEDHGFEFQDMGHFLEELRRFIEDPVYRRQKEAQLRARKLLITEEEFTENLKRIIEEDRSSYPIRSFDVDMRMQEALYADLWTMMNG